MTKPTLKLFWPTGSPITLVFWPLGLILNSKGNPFSRVLNTRGGKNLRFSTEISVYLGNGTRYAHGYYGMLMGSHGWHIEWYHCRWPWVTPNLGFKVTVYLQVDYLADGARVFNCTKHSCRSLGALPKTCKKLEVVADNFWLKALERV